MIKAVIFDMDGVIVDSEPFHVKAEKEVMLKYNITVSSQEIQRYTGTTEKFMFTDFIKRYGLDTTHDKMSKEKESVLLRLMKGKVKPTKGVLDLIKGLKQMGVKVAIASSARRAIANFFLRELDIRNLFRTIITAEGVTHSKPHPEIFLKAASALVVEPAKCIVVEDAKLGVEAAKRAGMKCLGYRSSHSGNQDLSKADMVIDDFSKLKISHMLSL